jgi:adenine-specific DNA-methyltransferase
MATLNWIGKEKVINHHLDVPFRTLKHKYTYKDGKTLTDGTRSENKIIHGDNLEALKSLLPEYEGKIKCIYIDPPYNTGNEGWVYNDNVNHPKIKKWLGEVVGKEGEDLSRHDKWLCMMYPRLKLLYRLLSHDGVIFISIDHNELANLVKILEEIFGSSNFIANVAVVNNYKGRSDDKYIATAHESLVIFHKGHFVSNGVPIPDDYVGEYKLNDGIGLYRLQGLRKRGSGAKRSDRPNMYYPFYYNLEKNVLSLSRQTPLDVEILPRLSDGSDGRWRWGKSTANERISELTAQTVKGRGGYDVFQKDYLEKEGDSKRVKPKSFWHGTEFSSEAGTLQLKRIFGNKTFDTPKSIDLIKYCLYQVSDQHSIVLDSFAGSGTTAHAVLDLNNEDAGNRKFILIELEEYADTVTTDRVRRVIQGYGQGDNRTEGTGGDFEFLELGEPLFTTDDYINENQPIEDIRKYVYYSETRTNTGYSDKPKNEFYLGKRSGTAYYFYYRKDSVTTLDLEFASKIEIKADQYIVYADKCSLSAKYLNQHNIIFKKIPRDITRI